MKNAGELAKALRRYADPCAEGSPAQISLLEAADLLDRLAKAERWSWAKVGADGNALDDRFIRVSDLEREQ